MPKAKKIKGEKNINENKISMEEEIIDHFINVRDSAANDDPNYYSIPLMMRLDRSHMAQLDHFAKLWKIKRSNLARQMLEEMIHLVMDRYYRDKTPEEYKMIHREIWDEFYKKQEAIKQKKEK
jgi:hypothetical protein